MTKLNEKQVRDPVIRWAKNNGVKSIRMYFGPGAKRGWPDDLFLIDGGRPLFIEFKGTGKNATPLQQRKIEILEDLDYNVCICDSSDAAITAITRAMEAA